MKRMTGRRGSRLVAALTLAFAGWTLSLVGGTTAAHADGYHFDIAIHGPGAVVNEIHAAEVDCDPPLGRNDCSLDRVSWNFFTLAARPRDGAVFSHWTVARASNAPDVTCAAGYPGDQCHIPSLNFDPFCICHWDLTIHAYFIRTDLTSGPAVTAGYWTNSSTPTFGFAANPSMIGIGGLGIFHCGWFPVGTSHQPLSACTGTTAGPASKQLPTLADGRWLFHVVAVGLLTKVYPVASVEFGVDTTAPVVQFIEAPPAVVVSNDEAQRFRFSAEDAGSGDIRFECRVDLGPNSACTTPMILSDGNRNDGVGVATNGRHTFTVTAIDAVGNRREIAREWEYQTPPVVTIDSGPADPVSERTARVVFRSTRADLPLSFECSLDLNAWGPCPGFQAHSPASASATVTGLADGRHTLRVRSLITTSLDGGRQHASAERAYAWTVDTVPPTTTIGDGPVNGLLTNQSHASFTFASEPSARFECSLDGGPYRGCSGPGAVDRLTDLAIGQHTFTVRAVDAAGNADPSPPSRSWIVTADLDGDGSLVGLDCDDNDLRRTPGKPDKPRNGIDEDCVGGDADYPLLPTRIVGHVAGHGAHDTFSRLYLERARGGSSVRLRCVRGCSYKPVKLSVKRNAGRLDLTRRVRRLELPRGAVFEVLVTKSGRIGVARRWHFRSLARPRPVDLCVRPRGRPRPCSGAS
jgi:hypothetical protein